MRTAIPVSKHFTLKLPSRHWDSNTELIPPQSRSIAPPPNCTFASNLKSMHKSLGICSRDLPPASVANRTSPSPGPKLKLKHRHTKVSTLVFVFVAIAHEAEEITKRARIQWQTLFFLSFFLSFRRLQSTKRAASWRCAVGPRMACSRMMSWEWCVMRAGQ